MLAGSFRAARWAALLVPLALMAGAWGSQLFGGLIPCEMCHWQRWPHYAAILLAMLGFILPSDGTKKVAIALAALAIITSGAIGVFHAGVEYHWWAGITACALPPASGGTADEMLARIMNTPVIACDVPQWSLFGISLAGFNALFSIGGGVAILLLLLRRQSA
ncbi:MAG: disulfide bond formation protein DsbB [Sphingomonas sp. 28-62-20]|uniref:disulfide bond formation protein B n=1 Tax=Sphingomonas sp. 28-62-20 TaxID=1970433 RepID=UPI000BD4633F|nr:MAG: disulfide bond formation protein DsbB [Sphingomonas sp. 28-62-20]